MEGQAEDRTSVAALKTQIQAQLVSRFSLKKPNLKSAAVLSSAVDPHYQKLSFLNLVQREEVKHTLMQEAAKVVAACNHQQPAEPAAKRSKKEAILTAFWAKMMQCSGTPHLMTFQLKWPGSWRRILSREMRTLYIGGT